MTDRIHYIDFLKFIGLTGIIIAHVGSPSWALMMRGFDVPFMVILSAILAERSYRKFEKDSLSAIDYSFSRIKRLVLPTWIFLIVYFVLLFIVEGELRGAGYYIASFCLTRYGIGYVWIILIYLYSALLIPLFSKLKLSIKGLIAVIVVYSLYEIAYYFKIGIDNKFIDTTVYYIIPYGVLTYLGYNCCQMRKKTRYLIIITSLLVFIALFVYYWIVSGSPQLVEIAKYPPRLYYLSYGIACSFGLITLCEKRNLKIFENSIIRYISMHSMWIYLWHILVLYADKYKVLRLPKVWYIKLFIVYGIAIMIVFVVNKCLDIIEREQRGFFKYLRG